MKSNDLEADLFHNQTLDLISQRRSVRSYTNQEVTEEEIRTLLDAARHSPSGGNMQPWRVHALGTPAIHRLRDAIQLSIEENGFSTVGDYEFYPERGVKDYWSRINQSGKDLHESLGISRREIQKIKAQRLRNFEFHGAPSGLIVTLNNQLKEGSWIDVGIFLGILITSITSINLGCCVQACFSSYGDVVRHALGLDSDEVIVCGVAIGHADTSAPINNQPHRRLDIDEFVRFHR